MGQEVVEIAGLFAHQMREHLALVAARQIGAGRGRRQVKLRGVTRVLGHGVSSVSEWAKPIVSIAPLTLTVNWFANRLPILPWGQKVRAG